MSVLAIAAISLLSGVLAYCVLWALAPVIPANKDEIATEQLHLTALASICVVAIVAIALGCAR